MPRSGRCSLPDRRIGCRTGLFRRYMPPHRLAIRNRYDNDRARPSTIRPRRTAHPSTPHRRRRSAGRRWSISPSVEMRKRNRLPSLRARCIGWNCQERSSRRCRTSPAAQRSMAAFPWQAVRQATPSAPSGAKPRSPARESDHRIGFHPMRAIPMRTLPERRMTTHRVSRTPRQLFVARQSTA